MKNKFIFLFLLLFIPIINIKAITCTYNIVVGDNNCTLTIDKDDETRSFTCANNCHDKGYYGNDSCRNYGFTYNGDSSYTISSNPSGLNAAPDSWWGNSSCEMYYKFAQSTNLYSEYQISISTTQPGDFTTMDNNATIYVNPKENPNPPAGSNPSPGGNPSQGGDPVNPPDPYKGAQKCTESGINEMDYIVACGCIPAAIADISSKVYYILRLIGPVILIIIGGIEMAKAVTTQDESAIAKAKKKLVNKAVAAAMIFLVLTLLKLGISIVRSQAQVADIYKCIDYLLNGYNI